MEQLGSRSPSLLGDLGILLAKKQEPEKAQLIIDELLARHQEHEKYTAYAAAEIYVALGNYSQSIKLLREAIEQKDNELNWLRVDQDFNPLQTHPDFIQIIQQLKGIQTK